MTPLVTSTNHPLHQSGWGKGCLAFTLLSKPGLSVKQELMPPATEEHLHYHQQAQQFFYILKGEAVFEVDEVIVIVHEVEGIRIETGMRHRIMNKTTGNLEFLVCSQPSTDNDRFNLA